MTSLLRPALSLFLVLTVITGIAYPLAVTGVAQAAFPHQAAGSLLFDPQGHAVGSTLIGQDYAEPGHFWGRPSATSPRPADPSNSAGSNLGPLNPALVDAVEARVAALHAADPGNTAPVPVDLVTTSASGFDPEISVAAALYQADRIARARGLSADEVRGFVGRRTTERLFGLLGEPRVNVLALNQDLDAVRPR
ncbi:MAG TPA: potassium-transporting ATPase subunit KdpC [Burkholderiaceae bacterium]|jgi:K+-transporting ATPase ATPase C chain|nr:potassium-transporting ATPase subunit KdpC [Burkholderiaceae bacterium]